MNYMGPSIFVRNNLICLQLYMCLKLAIGTKKSYKLCSLRQLIRYIRDGNNRVCLFSLISCRWSLPCLEVEIYTKKFSNIQVYRLYQGFGQTLLGTSVWFWARDSFFMTQPATKTFLHSKVVKGNPKLIISLLLPRLCPNSKYTRYNQ